MAKPTLENRDQRGPSGGWAPGTYECKCGRCGDKFIGDKRAVRCADCAYGSKRVAFVFQCPVCQNQEEVKCTRSQAVKLTVPCTMCTGFNQPTMEGPENAPRPHAKLLGPLTEYPLFGLKKWIGSISDWPQAKPPHLHVLLFPEKGEHIKAQVKTPEQAYDPDKPPSAYVARGNAFRQAHEIADRCGWTIDWQHEKEEHEKD